MPDKEDYLTAKRLPRTYTKKAKAKIRRKNHKPTTVPWRDIVHEFSLGTSYADLIDKYSVIEKDVHDAAMKTYSGLRDILETEALLKAHADDLNSTVSRTSAKMTLYKNQKSIDKDISTEFLTKLSDKNDTLLTQEETLFCYLLVHEGDEVEALISSGLAEGLTKSSTGYKRAIKLRILMVKGKPNIIRYISDLQRDFAQDLNIDKKNVQSEIVRQLKQLTSLNDPKLAPTIAKLTEQLGRTVGAFTDKVQVSEVSFDDAMDYMLEMRKANITEGQSGGGGEGLPDKANPHSEPSTFVYDPEKIG